MDFDNITQESLNDVCVRKHNDLIEAKYQLPNLHEQRIIFMLLGQIRPYDEDFKCYRLSGADFAEIVGLKGKDIYAELDRATKSLVSRTISIRKDEKSFLHVNWLSSAEYQTGSGYVELAFDPKLKPYLLQLKQHFTEYKIDTIFSFKSIYAIRLYELLKKDAFKAKGNQFKVYFEYTDLREKFGIGKKEYEKFKDFRVKTIDTAVKEISEKTDLMISEVKYGKTGRKITNITFIVFIRSQEEILQQAKIKNFQTKSEEEIHPIIEKMVSLGFSEEVAKKYKNKYGVKQIERNIAYTLAKNQTGLINDIPSYLNKAIESDLGGVWDINQQKELVEQQQKTSVEKAKQAEEKKVKQALKEQYNEAFERFMALSDEQKSLIKEQFIQESDTVVLNKMKQLEKQGKNFFDSVMVASNFKIFLVKQKLS